MTPRRKPLTIREFSDAGMMPPTAVDYDGRPVAEVTTACSVCNETRLWLRADGTHWCPSCRVELDAGGAPAVGNKRRTT